MEPPTIIEHPSAKFNRRPRGQQPSIIVIHFSATLTTEDIFDIFIGGQKSLSSHYVIDDHGLIYRLVDEKHRAWHAGRSAFAGIPDVNDFSIGIELRNAGRLTPAAAEGGFHTVLGQLYRPPPSPVEAGGAWWESYGDPQMESLIALCIDIVGRYQMPPDRIVGHSDVALPRGRKIDPGPLFDWNRLRQSLSGRPVEGDRLRK